MNRSIIKQHYNVEKLSSLTDYRKRFLINKAEYTYLLPVTHIALFFIENKVTYALDFSDRRHPITQSLEEIFIDVDPNQFFRINRQTIVNIDAIDRIENWFNDRLLVLTKPKHHAKILVPKGRKRLFLNYWLDR